MGTKGAVWIMMVFALVRSFVRSPATEAWIHATQTVSQGDRSRRQETRGRERERERELNQHLCIEAHEEHLDCISPSCERETALARTPVSFPLDTKNWAKREQQRQTSRREREKGDEIRITKRLQMQQTDWKGGVSARSLAASVRLACCLAPSSCVGIQIGF